jgi:hypothetical protein
MNDSDDAFEAMFKHRIDSLIQNSTTTTSNKVDEDKVVQELLTKVRDKSPVIMQTKKENQLPQVGEDTQKYVRDLMRSCF